MQQEPLIPGRNQQKSKVMKRSYMYLIYRLHDFFAKKDTTPIGDTVLVMSIIHFLQALTIFLYLNLLLGFKLSYFPKNIFFYAISVIYFLIYYFLVFHNGKWKNWAKEFKKESAEERRRNGLRVWFFCWGSVVFFFLSLIILNFIIN